MRRRTRTSVPPTLLPVLIRPPTTLHDHHHYNIHVVSDVDGPVSELREVDRLTITKFQPIVPIVPEYSMFVHNHFGLLLEPAPQQTQLPIHSDNTVYHNYIHLHHHHDLNEGNFDYRLLTRHIPSLHHLVSIENPYPQNPKNPFK
ncbi:hypothetical protein POM88_054132 [Heracleum sosnowskyi]|uniref:Uncharacterized protein n=1 Tax=Heracleum sosnowskyi TaxID=360622 RepID=A0AAD8GPC7_9APIA|nr:hypothetical protein POM88_054132 [Heracleum sosnowskyi]